MYEIEIIIELKAKYRKKMITSSCMLLSILLLITAIAYTLDKSAYKKDFYRYKDEYPSLHQQYLERLNEYKNHDPTIGGFDAYCDVGEVWIEGEDATDTMCVKFYEGAAAYDEYTLDEAYERYIPFNSPFHVIAFIYDSEYDDEYPMLYSIDSSPFTISPEYLDNLSYEETDEYGDEEIFYEDFNVDVSFDGFFFEEDDPYYVYKEYDVSVNATLTFHVIEDSVDLPGPMAEPKEPELPKFEYSFWIFLKRNTPIKWIFFIWVAILFIRLRSLRNNYWWELKERI